MADVNIKYQGTSIATIDASGSKTLQTSGKYCEGDITVEYTDPEKPTQTKSATPTETAQDITPDSGKVLSKVSVGAIPKTYVGSGVTKKTAATVSPSTSEQTVCASGVYTTGAQKVAAITKNLLAQLDPDFVAANIKKDVDLFGLVGTLEAGGGGGGAGAVSGTITPAASGIQTITHGLGKQPTGILIFQNNKAPSSKTSGVYAAFGDQNGQGGIAYYGSVISTFYATSISEFVQNCFIMDADAETFKVAFFGPINTVALAALIVGVEYRWYVW